MSETRTRTLLSKTLSLWPINFSLFSPITCCFCTPKRVHFLPSVGNKSCDCVSLHASLKPPFCNRCVPCPHIYIYRLQITCPLSVAIHLWSGISLVRLARVISISGLWRTRPPGLVKSTCRSKSLGPGLREPGSLGVPAVTKRFSTPNVT